MIIIHEFEEEKIDIENYFFFPGFPSPFRCLSKRMEPLLETDRA